MDCGLPGSSVFEILHARIWSGDAFLQGLVPTQNQTWVSCIAGGLFTDWVTREAPVGKVPR